MNTSYFQKGLLIKKKKEIIKNYLKTGFFLDILTLIVYMIELPGYEYWKLMKLIFFLKWKKLREINIKLIEEFRVEVIMHHSYLNLLHLLLFCFFFMHIFACLWVFLAFVYQDTSNITWLSKLDLTHASSVYQYLFALYWSTVTLMTVGYGDISAQNIHEICFSIITINVGCGILAYIINTIGLVIGDINKERNLFQ